MPSNELLFDPVLVGSTAIDIEKWMSHFASAQVQAINLVKELADDAHSYQFSIARMPVLRVLAFEIGDRRIKIDVYLSNSDELEYPKRRFGAQLITELMHDFGLDPPKNQEADRAIPSYVSILSPYRGRSESTHSRVPKTDEAVG